MLKQKRIYIWVDQIFAKTLKISFCGDFCALWAHLNYYSKTRSVTFLTLGYLGSWKYCIADRWKDEQNQIYRTLQLGWVPNYSSHHADITNFQLQCSGTLLWTDLEQKQQRWQQNQTWIIFMVRLLPTYLLFNYSIAVT